MNRDKPNPPPPGTPAYERMREREIWRRNCAKEVLIAYLSNTSLEALSIGNMATVAVGYADALLAELEKGEGEC